MGFPGRGDKHIYTFNPMKEFINNYEDHMETAFDRFRNTHDRDYINQMEHHRRKEIFRQNLRCVLLLKIYFLNTCMKCAIFYKCRACRK